MELTNKNQVGGDGPQRFFRAKKNLPTSKEIEEKYAGKIANANPAEKIKIQQEMVQKLLRREKTAGHKPSAGTLW